MNKFTCQQSPAPPPFETFFAAESYLEIQGYECHREQWTKPGSTSATVVAKPNGDIEVVFEPDSY